MPAAFVDTNVLLYAVSNHPAERQKSQIAQRLLVTEDLALSVQVLQEFYANAIQPRKLGFTKAEAMAFCQVWMEFPVVSLTVDTFVHALELSVRFDLSNWDAAILASARASGCAAVYSEDFQDGHDYNGVRVINPFKR
jgi:predicted nucleic acid-binding protein